MNHLQIVLLAASCMCGQDYRAVTRDSYDTTAAEYQHNTEKFTPETKAKAFLSYLPANARLLDLGCGPGRDAVYFSQQGYRVTGVDISPQMIDMAKSAAPNAEFIVSDIESLNPTPDTFDAVWASASLLHVSKQAMPDTLAKLYRTLKAGGIFYVSMKKGKGEHIQPDDRYGGVEKFWNYVDEEELLSLLQEQGFEVLEQQTHAQSTSYQTHPWIAVICRRPVG